MGKTSDPIISEGEWREPEKCRPGQLEDVAGKQSVTAIRRDGNAWLPYASGAAAGEGGSGRLVCRGVAVL